tara:strand:+ start:244 stop:549 length:306 start_codon:yes stop_codon:yes gene_type:complete
MKTITIITNQTKLLTICLLLFTSQVFAWSDAEYEAFFGGCIDNTPSNLSYKKREIYCTCSTDLVSYTWTVKEVQKMVLNNTFAKQKDVIKITKRCAKKIGF